MPDRRPSRAAICTIGYERAKLADFLRTLQEAGVAALFDIRARAWSRRSEFAAKQLAAALEDGGIAYRHLPALGSPDAARAAAGNGDVATFERLYCDRLETDAARAALDTVLEAATRAPVCLMCYERDPRECHRRFTVAALAARRPIDVRQLFAAEAPKQPTLI